MSILFSKEEMAAGFVECDGKSGYRNLDKNRIDLIKGPILFYYYSISKLLFIFLSLLYQKTAQRESLLSCGGPFLFH